MVHATTGLLDALLEAARRREPERLTVGLAVTRAGAFPELDLPADTPVFTDFYLPDAGRSVEAVFGVDLGTPSGQTPGLIVSHPNGVLALERTDDLREVVIVAVPPWDRDAVAAFGRDGSPRDLDLVDAELPEESIP